jgi:hypothetical protein
MHLRLASVQKASKITQEHEKRAIHVQAHTLKDVAGGTGGTKGAAHTRQEIAALSHHALCSFGGFTSLVFCCTIQQDHDFREDLPAKCGIRKLQGQQRCTREKRRQAFPRITQAPATLHLQHNQAEGSASDSQALQGEPQIVQLAIVMPKERPSIMVVCPCTCGAHPPRSYIIITSTLIFCADHTQ